MRGRLLALATAVFLTTSAAAQECHPNYEGACVPNKGVDVDCLGGQGNGPEYPDRHGPFRRVGPDVFKLDRDGDGLACEPPNEDY